MIYLGLFFSWQFSLFLVMVVIIPLAALVDILKSDFKENDKILWLFIVLFFSFIGSILYFMIGKKQKIA